MKILPKVIYIFNANPIKIPVVLVFRNGKVNSTIHMRLQGILSSQNDFGKEHIWRKNTFQFPNFLQISTNSNSGTGTKIGILISRIEL